MKKFIVPLLLFIILVFSGCKNNPNTTDVTITNKTNHDAVYVCLYFEGGHRYFYLNKNEQYSEEVRCGQTSVTAFKEEYDDNFQKIWGYDWSRNGNLYHDGGQLNILLMPDGMRWDYKE